MCRSIWTDLYLYIYAYVSIYVDMCMYRCIYKIYILCVWYILCYMCMDISAFMPVCVCYTHTYVCVTKGVCMGTMKAESSSGSTPRECLCGKQVPIPQEKPCWVMHMGRAWGIQGSCTPLPFPGRWRGKTLHAVLKITLCVSFLQVGPWQHWGQVLTITGLKDLGRVWNLDCLKCSLCECLHALGLPSLPVWHLSPLDKAVVQVLCFETAGKPSQSHWAFTQALHIYVYIIMCYE